MGITWASPEENIKDVITIIGASHTTFQLNSFAQVRTTVKRNLVQGGGMCPLPSAGCQTCFAISSALQGSHATLALVRSVVHASHVIGKGDEKQCQQLQQQ